MPILIENAKVFFTLKILNIDKKKIDPQEDEYALYRLMIISNVFFTAKKEVHGWRWALG